MRSLFKSKLVQIEVTNACINQCANCTRCVGHHPKPYFMDLETIEKAIDSLDGFDGEIGLMGGEPTLHPKFLAILQLFQKKIPRERRGFWTSGHKWCKYRNEIEQTFDKERIIYNEHSTDGGIHQPILASMEDLVKDKEFREELKENCWVQRRWETCSITPYGIYFCEIAGALDILFNGGRNAVTLTKDWWKNNASFKHQYKICDRCGITIPIGGVSDRATFDLISKSNYGRLNELNSPKVATRNFALYDKKWSKDEIIKKSQDWKPWNFRNFYASCPEDYFRNNKN